MTDETVYGRYSFVDGKLINKEVIKKWNGVFVLGVEGFDGGFCDAGAILYGDTVIKGKVFSRRNILNLSRNTAIDLLSERVEPCMNFQTIFKKSVKLPLCPISTIIANSTVTDI